MLKHKVYVELEDSITDEKISELKKHIAVLITSDFATTYVVVPGHCNEKFCFENILYFRCK